MSSARHLKRIIQNLMANQVNKQNVKALGSYCGAITY